MPLESRVDVLIIGAGPTGVMCANALATAGADVRIIDKRYETCSTMVVAVDRLLIGFSPKMVAAGQADGIQPRTIEVLQV
jgi:phenol 2-monooxygenase